MHNTAQKQSIEQWQQRLLEECEYAEGRVIHFKSLWGGDCVAYSENAQLPGKVVVPDRRFLDFLPRVKAVIVGLDIREYSRRSPEHQLFLTMNLHAWVEKALASLPQSIFPPKEPRIKIQTGDGAFLVFTFPESEDPWLGQDEIKEQIKVMLKKRELMNKEWPSQEGEKDPHDLYRRYVKSRRTAEDQYLPSAAGQALSFIFAFNAIMREDNHLQRFAADSDQFGKSGEYMHVFPAECRYAVSFDDVLLLKTHGNANCVGKGMVTCARILATDHSNHLLIDNQLIKGLERHGGLDAACGGAWRHTLYTALLNEKKVKSGQFRYVDVFGHYYDTLMLRGFGKDQREPRKYKIGCHDGNSLDSDG